MAQILIQKILNNEILTEDLLGWISDLNSETEKFAVLSQLCSQKEFITYFLNAIHDQLHCDRNVETPKKPKIPTTPSCQAGLRRGPLFNESQKNEVDFPELICLNDSSHHTLNNSCKTSTPKNNKSISYDRMNDTFSPIHKSSSSFQREHDSSKSSSICLADFIVPNRKSNVKKKIHKSHIETEKITPKRINPTNLNKKRFDNLFTKSENSFNFENNSNNVLVKSEVDNRDLLKKEIEKLNVQRNSIDENILEQIKRSTKNNLEIYPNPKLVRFKVELNKIILIYQNLLEKGLILNFIGEFYFIISLLLNKCYCDDSKLVNTQLSVTFKELFETIHNVVFFASSMLDNFKSVFKSLDKPTLKYILDNDNLKLFSPNTLKKIQRIYEKKTERISNIYETNKRSNICFILDTDNRYNFPSNQSFLSFKKQRDMFYEILKIWEDNHMVPNWNFESSLGRKVRTLLGYHSDPVNLMRLSRLFMDQLLSMCGRNVSDEISTEIKSSLLTSLPNIDRDKFDRLNSRLVTKEASNGINSVPDFTGYQEFFKDFILISSNSTFLRHLCDTFIAEIVELNDTAFTNLEAESNDNETDNDTKKAYVNCLKSLRTLAKFLGFVESLPYKWGNSLITSDLFDLQIKIRDKVKPCFDVDKLLDKAILNGTVTLCIPWLCKYLSMLDPVTLKTSYYVNLIKILINLYRNFENFEYSVPEYNLYLVRFTLGWLFELNNFPHTIFFENLTPNFRFNVSNNQKSINLDSLRIVDQNVLYIFCPYLEEIKKLLASKIVARDRLTVRHITPLTATEPARDVAKKKIENQLEEAFFNGHPASLRKTVDFVAERIASNCVKHLCYTVVPEFKVKFGEKLQTRLKEFMKNEDITEISLKNECGILAEESLIELNVLCEAEVNKIVKSNLRNAIHSLLTMDCLPQMETICVSTSKRICLEKVKQWMSTHIIIGVLKKEIPVDIHKRMSEDALKNKPKPVQILPSGGLDVPHNEDTVSAAHILETIRNMCVSMLSTTDDLEEKYLLDFLETVYKTLTQRNDVSEAVQSIICTQLVDYLLLLVAFQPYLVEKSQSEFIRIWKLRGENTEDLFSNLLSPRNTMLLAQTGRNSTHSWTAKAKLCVVLIKENLLSCECFESQCIGFFNSNLDEETLTDVTNFLRIFVDKYKEECRSSKFTFLLEFLSDYCSDL